MEQEYDGKIDNIGLPDMILLEVQTSVLVESNYLDTHSEKVPYSSGSKGQLDTDLLKVISVKALSQMYPSSSIRLRDSRLHFVANYD